METEQKPDIRGGVETSVDPDAASRQIDSLAFPQPHSRGTINFNYKISNDVQVTTSLSLLVGFFAKKPWPKQKAFLRQQRTYTSRQ